MKQMQEKPHDERLLERLEVTLKKRMLFIIHSSMSHRLSVVLPMTLHECKSRVEDDERTTKINQIAKNN